MGYMKHGFAALGIVALLGCSDGADEQTGASADAEEMAQLESELAQVESQLADAQKALAQAAGEMSESESAEIAAQASQAVEQVAEAVSQVAAAEPAVDPGAAYLHINAQKPGVRVTESGLQYEVLKSGDGKSPELTSTVATHYEGAFIDGTVFDSSVQRGTPAEFPVNRVIAGWTEALQMMKEGDKWRLAIPSDLAYGSRGAGGGRIPPDAVLVFEVELLEVK